MPRAGTKTPQRCRDLVSLAAFEIAAGFIGTAREHLVNAAHCTATGCCASPGLCRAAAAADPAGASVLRFPVPQRRAGAGPGRPAPVVPLAAAAAAVPAADRAGNRLERRTLALRQLADSRRLAPLLDYWRELWLLSRGTMIDFDAVRLVQMGALGWVHLIDVGDPDPARFAIAIRGWRVPNAEIDESREGMRLAEHPVRLLARTVMEDYAAARAAEAPLFHGVRSHLRGHSYFYRRLILPLSSNGKATDRLLVATDFG